MRMSRHLGLTRRVKPKDTSVSFGTLVWSYGSGSTWTNVKYVGRPSGYRQAWCYVPITVKDRAAKIAYINFDGYKQSITNGTYVVRICATNSSKGSAAVTGGAATVSFTNTSGTTNTSNGHGYLKATFSNCTLPVGTYWCWVYNTDSNYSYFGNGTYPFKYLNSSITNG